MSGVKPDHDRTSIKAQPVLVTVVIPAYNATGFIETAVMSALSQTLSDLEVLVVDDHSSDNTRAVVERLAVLDPRVRLLENSGLQGPSGGRNTGLSAASGTWVAILDADDSFEPSRLQDLLESATQRSLDAISDNISVIDFETRASLETAFPPDMMARHAPIDIDWILDHDSPGTHAHRPFGFSKIVISKSFLDESGIRYMEDISLGEDFLFYVHLILAGCRLGIYDKSLYVSTQRAGSLSYKARDFTQLVEVNRRVRVACERYRPRDPSSALREDVLQRLGKRQDAFLYREFCAALKASDAAGCLRALKKLRIGYLIAGLFRASARRIPGLGAGV